MRRLFILVFATLLLGACSTYTLVKGERIEVSEAFSVNPQINWSRLREGHIDIWTVDGDALQAIRFLDGVRDGHGLLETPRGGDSEMPPFRKDMTATEIQELVIDTLAKLGGGNVESSNLDPIEFGSEPGFRFDLSFLTTDGLEMDGIVAGAVMDEKLYLILYTAVRQYYFQKYRDPVERLIGSIQTGV